MTALEEIAKLEYELECYKYVVAAITYSHESYIGKSSPEEWKEFYMKHCIVKVIEDGNWHDDRDLRRTILRKGPPIYNGDFDK